ncbi:MAG: substrate-binding domain-containing protein [Flavobacteriaceae bacterium]
MDKKKYTIKDIARLAGVSKGTVDRVLHKRGRVSQKAFEKVDAVLKRIDYQPNPIARNLKTNKVYTICALLPDPEIDPYWSPALEGIHQAEKEFTNFGVTVEAFFYHPYNEASFVAVAQKALQSEPDALLMAPLFHNESLNVFRKCVETNVVVASFNNTIDPLNNENFIGQDLYQSGRVAASLIHKMIGKDASVCVVHINVEPHMLQKENGFMSYFQDKCSGEIDLFTHQLSTDGVLPFKEQVQHLIKENQDLSAIFVTNSKAHLLIEALHESGNNYVVVGYDLLKENINYIKNGAIDFLIHQKPKRQAYLGVGQLAEHFLFGKEIPSRKLLPIDVVTSENVNYYLN